MTQNIITILSTLYFKLIGTSVNQNTPIFEIYIKEHEQPKIKGKLKTFSRLGTVYAKLAIS